MKVTSESDLGMAGLEVPGAVMPRHRSETGMAPGRTHARAARWARRYGWVAYWLAFAAWTLNEARYPGFVPNPETVPYPWAAALFTCTLLFAQTAALNSLLRPLHATGSWRRVAAASGLALLFAAVSLVTMWTDMPGYYYAPRLFALVNVLVVPLVGAVLAFRPTRPAAEAGEPEAVA